MAADKFTIEFDVTGMGPAMREINQLASQLSSMGAGTVSRGLAELGLEAAEVVPWVSAVTVGLAAMAAAAKMAANDLQRAAQQQGQMAATGTETAMMRLLGRAGGFDATGAGRSFLSGARSGPMGTLGALSLGVPLAPNNITGRFDEAQIFLQAMDRASSMSARSAGSGELQLARLGRDDLAFLLPVWKDIRREVEGAAQAQAQAYSPEALARGIKFNAQLAILQGHFQALATTLGTMLIPYIDLWVRALGSVASALTGISQWTEKNLPQALNVATGGLSGALKGLWDAFHPGGQKAAMDANTAAVRDNTYAVKDLQRGVFGGGARARGAIPGAFQGGISYDGHSAIRDVYGHHAARLGAYAIGL